MVLAAGICFSATDPSASTITVSGGRFVPQNGRFENGPGILRLMTA
jgi:hypothetical protein